MSPSQEGTIFLSQYERTLQPKLKNNTNEIGVVSYVLTMFIYYDLSWGPHIIYIYISTSFKYNFYSFEYFLKPDLAQLAPQLPCP